MHDAAGKVVGTVCVLDDNAREYTEDQRRELERLRADVETLVERDDTALG